MVMITLAKHLKIQDKDLVNKKSYMENLSRENI